MSDNGTMFWPATTTTAVIDPTSREVLDVILGKKEDKPIEITECIPSRLMSINSAEDAVTLTSAEEAQLAPLITGFTTTGTKFTCGTLPAVTTDYTNAYSWEIWGLPGLTARLLSWIKLHYIDEEVNGNTVRSYWVESGFKEVLFTDSISSDEPTFLDIDLADLESETVSTFLTEYYPSSEEDPLPSSTIEDSEGKYKNIILRIRVLEEDNPEGMTSEDIDEDYWNFSIKLTPLTLETADNAWNSYDNFLFGSYIYSGTTYSAIISKIDTGYTYYIQKFKLENLGIITSLSAYEDVPVYPTAGDDINIAFGKINRIVQSHEEVTARALLDLNSRIQSLTGNIGIQEITWSALKTLRDGGNLAPGKFYRITDYTCTTTQTDTQSAGHIFDIIVLALSGSVLLEEAWAIQHSGDIYFANSNLAAWKLKYCLDNNTDRFTWTDTTNGKGVIYWMKDEWENECSYDFKNIQFKRQLTDGSLDTTSGTNTWCYTFNYWNSTTGASEDLTMHGMDIVSNSGITDNIVPCYNNKFKEVNYRTGPWENLNIILPDNVFLATSLDGGIIKNNIFEGDCRNNTFGQYCNDNTFGRNCFYNVFGNYCQHNTFGDYCYNNIFENSCYNNTFGQYCNHITFSKEHTIWTVIDSNNCYITLTSSLTIGNNYLKNIYIASGVNTTSTTKTISHNSLNDTFITTYKPANSVEISV